MKKFEETLRQLGNDLSEELEVRDVQLIVLSARVDIAEHKIDTIKKALLEIANSL